AVWAAFRPAILDCDVTAFDPTEFAEASHKSSRAWSKARGARTQKPNSWKLARLLRTCDERPRSRCAEKWHELAPSHRPHGSRKGIVSAQTRTMEEAEFAGQAAVLDVRFGSEADILGDLPDVRFASESGHR